MKCKSLLVFCLLISNLAGSIIEISEIDTVRNSVKQDALYLFDIDDTLIDNPSGLGSIPWRAWFRSKGLQSDTSFTLFDALTYYIAKHIPYKAVEPTTAKLIADLQFQGIAVLEFTARGRTQWYTTVLDHVDRFTHAQLKNAGIDFTKTTIPEGLKNLEPAYFYEGIIFAQHISKGELLKDLLKDINYRPSLLVFIDDKLEQIESVEKIAEDIGIPFVGYWYRRAEQDKKNFDPLIAAIQLEHLLIKKENLNDEDAAEMSKSMQKADPEYYFKSVLNRIDLKQQLTPWIEPMGQSLVKPYRNLGTLH